MDGSGFAGRIEVLEAGGGRRVWPVETKLRIVAESYAAGASVMEVARRYDLSAAQVTTWRRLYRRGELVPRGSPPLPPTIPREPVRAERSSLEPSASGMVEQIPCGPAFVPLMLDAEPRAAEPDPPAPAAAAPTGPIELEVGGVVLRLPGDASPDRLAAIVAALRAAP